jgi:hypothetical protein
MIANKLFAIQYLTITIHCHLTYQILFLCYFRKNPCPKDHTFRWFDINQSMFIFLTPKAGKHEKLKFLSRRHEHAKIRKPFFYFVLFLFRVFVIDSRMLTEKAKMSN